MVQWLEGTAFFFRCGCAVFILVATFAFNPPAASLARQALTFSSIRLWVVIVGVCYKAFLGEPGQSNLVDPRTTIEVYVGGITAMLGAVIVSSRFRRKTGLLQNMGKESQMYRASVGCMAFGIAGAFIIALLGESGVRLQSAFHQPNRLVPLGIVIGVMYEIRRSGGTRSVNLPHASRWNLLFSEWRARLLQKRGMLSGPVLLVHSRVRSPVSPILFAGGLLPHSGRPLFLYLVPYSQYGRRFLTEKTTVGQSMTLAVNLLGHPEDTRQTYNHEQEEGGAGGLGAYYNTPQGFWDRLEFISVDDRLINVTDQGHVFGLLPLKAELLNSIPHVFWKDKPTLPLGNIYAHEVGEVVPPDDNTTGISFSPTAEAYHMATWTGVLVIAPLVWFILFVVYDSLFGDLRATPWGLLVVALFSHFAPEGALTGVIYQLTFGVETFVFCAFFATWFAPIFAIPLLGPDRRGVEPLHSSEPVLDS